MKFLIWSNVYRRWWRPGQRGYTSFIEEAGRYTEAEARRLARDSTADGCNTVEAVDLATGERYRQLPDWAVVAPEFAASGRPPVVALIGPAEFRKAEHDDVAAQLTLSGFVVLPVGVYDLEARYPNEVQRQAVEESLAELQRRKIDLAGTVFVVNPGGRLDTDTRDLIAYALRQGIAVRYYGTPVTAPSSSEDGS